MSQEHEEAEVERSLKYLEGVYLDAEIERRIERDRKRLHFHYVIITPARPQKELRRPRRGGVDQWKVLI